MRNDRMLIRIIWKVVYYIEDGITLKKVGFIMGQGGLLKQKGIIKEKNITVFKRFSPKKEYFMDFFQNF